MVSPNHTGPFDGQSEAERLELPMRIIVLLMFLGGLTTVIALATVEMSDLGFAAHIGLTVVLFGMTIAISVVPPNVKLMKSAVLVAVVAISGLIAGADYPGTTPFFYLWPAVFAAYFSSPRFLAAVMVEIAVAFAVALGLSNMTMAVRVDHFIGTVLCVGMMAWLVGYMRSRAERLHRRLELAAHTDALTGLMNRRAFDPELERLVATATATGTQLSVVMFDIDHFKRFNDDHGHIVGDDALRRMGAVLVEQCRPVDLVARFGGEEFVVVLPGIRAPGARSLAERVAWALGVEPVDIGLRLTTSSGVSTLDPDSHSETTTALLTRADQALYAAKAGGRARAAWWTIDGIEVGDEVDVPAAQDGERNVAVTTLPQPRTDTDPVSRPATLVELPLAAARQAPERRSA